MSIRSTTPDPIEVGDRIQITHRDGIDEGEYHFVTKIIGDGTYEVETGDIVHRHNITYCPTVEEVWRRAKQFYGGIRNPLDDT